MPARRSLGKSVLAARKILLEDFDEFEAFPRVRAFRMVIMSAQIERAFDVVSLFGTGKDHHDHVIKGLAVEPFEDLEAGFAWHLQIQQHHVRHWVLLAVGVLAGAFEVGNDFLAIGHAADEAQTLGLAQSHLN